MKKIELKSNAHAEILAVVLETAPSGMTIGEVRQAIKLIDKLLLFPSFIAVDDAEYSFISQRFGAAKFARVSREIVELADSIENAVELREDSQEKQ